VNEVFLDTVGLIGLWDEDDQWREAAERAFRNLVQSGLRPVTTTFVLLECGNAGARRPFRPFVNQLRLDLVESGGLIVPTPVDWEEAWKQYAEHESLRAGIVDHVSFVVMRRLNIPAALTNDRHFQATGFEVLF
jgi:uncharacterized protein